MATLVSGLGGTAGYGENTFSTSAYTRGTGTGADDAYIKVDISSVFGASGMKFYGASYTSLYISSNGIITFGSGLTSYTPTALTSLGKPSISPFWTDIDINKGGEIYWDLDPASGKVTVTWSNVAAYTGTGRDSFQVELSNLGSGNTGIQFLYGAVGFANGNTGNATVGISNGSTSQTLLNGSGNGTTLLTYASNDFQTNDPLGVTALA